MEGEDQGLVSNSVLGEKTNAEKGSHKSVPCGWGQRKDAKKVASDRRTQGAGSS